MSTLKQGESLYLTSPYLKVGLSWDILGKETIDLDASCVIFNEFGKIMDAVYYNQTEVMDKAVTHSGDNTTGEGEGDDEVIMIDLSKIDRKAKALVILVTCYKQGTFANVETASASLKNSKTDETIVNISLGCQGKHTGLIMATIYKDDQDIWYVKNIRQNCDARDFLQAEIAMKEQLYFLIPKELMNELKWDPRQDKPFNLKKNDVVAISGEKFLLGLGWDTRCDLDANCTLISYDMNDIEDVYFRNKRDYAASILHSGDNTTGEGEGDDEKINIDLSKVPIKYSTIVCSICVYTANMNFTHVQGAYVRLLDSKGREMLKYKLDGKYDLNAMIMCKLERQDSKSGWKFKAIGEGARGRVVTEIRPSLLLNHFKKQLEKEKIESEKRSKLFKEMNGLKDTLQKVETELKNAPSNIKIEEVDYELKCSATDLEKKSFFGDNDPYFIIYDGKGKKLYRSESKKYTLKPKWQDFKLVRDAKFGDEKLTFSFHDEHLLSEPSYIGRFILSLNEMVQQKTIPIVNQEKVGKRGYSDSGKFNVEIAIKKFEREIKNQKIYEIENKIKELKIKISSYEKQIKEI